MAPFGVDELGEPADLALGGLLAVLLEGRGVGVHPLAPAQRGGPDPLEVLLEPGAPPLEDAEADVAGAELQYGSTLSGWTGVTIGAVSSGPDANGVVVNVTENADAPDTIVVQIPRTLAPDGKLFGRVKVTK